jgi:hypothetical protein
MRRPIIQQRGGASRARPVGLPARRGPMGCGSCSSPRAVGIRVLLDSAVMARLDNFGPLFAGKTYRPHAIWFQDSRGTGSRENQLILHDLNDCFLAP